IDGVNDEGNHIDAEAAAQDGLRIELIGEANTRLEVVFVPFKETAVLVIDEEQAALDVETARRNLRDRVGGISGLGCRLDGAADVRIKAADVAVEALRRRCLILVPQAEIQG